MRARLRSHFRCRLLPSATAALCAVLVLVALPLQADTVTAAQGTLARWSGDDVNSCGMDGRVWKPVDGTCWFPVDLERRPGRVEIARWRDGSGLETAWLIVEDKEYDLQEIEFPDDKYVHLSSEDLARHYAEQAEIKPVFRRRSGPATFTLPLAPPADPLPEGRFFGVRREFNGEPKNAHTGTDYAINLGTSVKSVADGTVVLTGDHFFAGKSVYVYHGNGLVSMYYHLSEIKAEAGQEVKRGDEVALVGSTGRSTGPHLHLGIRWRGARVDPSLLLGDPESVPAVTP